MAQAFRFGVALAIALAAVGPPLPAAPVGKEASPPSSERLQELQKERVKALEEQIQGQFERVKIGKDPLIQYIEAIRELAEAELDVAETKDARIKAVEKWVRELTTCEEELVK